MEKLQWHTYEWHDEYLHFSLMIIIAEEEGRCKNQELGSRENVRA